MNWIYERRRALIASQSDIPAGYTPLKYIESSGHQWIQTNYTPVIGDDITFDFMRKSEYGCCFSAGTSTYQLIVLFPRYFKYFTTGAEGETVNFSVNEQYKLNFTTDGTLYRYMNGELQFTYTVEVSKTKGAVNTPLYIMRRASGSDNSSLKFIRYYTPNKVDIVPLLRDSDEKPGAYDKVSNMFYENAGTGEFGYEFLDGTYVAPV